MAAINRTQLKKELEPGLNTLFGLSYKEYEPEHTAIYVTETSSRAFEEELALSGFGEAQVKAEGDSISFDTAQEAYTSRYQHETIALGFAITQEAIDDGLYDSLSARYTKALARSMAQTKQIKAVYPLNNAFSAYTSGDGVSLCNTAHPLVSGGTNANRPTTAADMNETSLENMVIQMADWTDQRGLLIAARPRKLIIPVELQFIAERLLKTGQRPATADNDVNAIKSTGAIPGGYSINHYLTDPNAFFCITDVPNGMKHFVRKPLSKGMDDDFVTGNMMYKTCERYSFGNSDPLGIWGSPGAS